MILRITAVAIGGLLLMAITACTGGRTYPTNLPDSAYNLGAMALQQSDVPASLHESQLAQHEYDNAAWAKVLNASAPAATQKDLTDNIGRVRGWVTAFQASQYQKVFAITAISTLYTTVAKAEQQLAGYCGVPSSKPAPPASDRFVVPKIGDQATGFFVTVNNTQGQQFIDTTICFRTGRILHAIQSTGLPGTEDVAAAIGLAQAMLQHVNDAFDGKIPPTTPTPVITPPPSPGAASPSAAAGASATPAAGTPAAGSTAATASPPASATATP